MASAFTRGLSRHGLLKEDIAIIEKALGITVKAFDLGEHLIRKGERILRAHLIIQGWAFRYKILPNGRRQIIALLLPGDLSDVCLFIMPEADHSIACLTPVTAIELSAEALDTFFNGQHPRIAQALWSKTFSAACVQREWVVNLGQRSAPERIGHILCELFHRLDAAGLTNGKEFPCPLTQNDLADATGLSLVHVNKRLQDLRHQGLIAFGGKVLSIPDLPALERASFFSSDYLRIGLDPIPQIVDDLLESIIADTP